MVEFIEEREDIKSLYPESILQCFVPLNEEQEKFVCTGCMFDGSNFKEPEYLSALPTIGGHYEPIDKTKLIDFIESIDFNSEKYINNKEFIIQVLNNLKNIESLQSQITQIDKLIEKCNNVDDIIK